jgi:hypothetical protein
MLALLRNADRVLRADIWSDEESRSVSQRMLLATILICGLLYGTVMGSFSGLSPERYLQVLVSAGKVPLLLVITFVVCLPSFFVINTLIGLRDDFPRVLRALVATQAALTIILAALAPVTALWYASSADYRLAILFNALMFGVASAAAQRVLRRLYQPLIRRNRRHRQMIWIWLVLFAFVGIETGWVLRPFIGDPQVPVQFFRHEAWGNAYEVLARMIWEVLSRTWRG